MEVPGLQVFDKDVETSLEFVRDRAFPFSTVGTVSTSGRSLRLFPRTFGAALSVNLPFNRMVEWIPSSTPNSGGKGHAESGFFL